MSIILPNLNHSFISPVPVPDPDFRVFHTPMVNWICQAKAEFKQRKMIKRSIDFCADFDI